MAAPVEESIAETESSAAQTSHVITMPSGIVSGDLLICFFGADDAGTNAVTFPEGWNEIAEGTNNSILAIAWREATGSDSLTITTDDSEDSAAVVVRISGAADPDTQPPQVSTVATGCLADAPRRCRLPTRRQYSYQTHPGLRYWR